MNKHHEEHHVLNHEEHHECTGLGEHAWCGIEDYDPKAEAAALAEAMERAPGFD